MNTEFLVRVIELHLYVGTSREFKYYSNLRIYTESYFINALIKTFIIKINPITVFNANSVTPCVNATLCSFSTTLKTYQHHHFLPSWKKLASLIVSVCPSWQRHRRDPGRCCQRKKEKRRELPSGELDKGQPWTCFYTLARAL